jgi:drug/metabolite transporter (DMT)-like permease
VNNSASYLRLGALALLWGSSFLLIKVALNALTPVQVALVRIILGAAVLLLLCALRGMRLRGFVTSDGHRLWGHVAVAALFASAMPWVLFGIGEQTVDSGLTGVLNATTPLWTVLFGLLFGREAGTPPSRFAGLLLGFTGVVLICAPWQGGGTFGWGVLACLAAAASYGVGYVYIGRNLTGARLREKGLSPLTLAAMQMTAAAGIALVALPAGGLQPVRLELPALLAVAVLGVFGTGIAFALNYRIISDEGATTASTVTYLMPIVSVLLGWLVLNERLGFRMLLGMIIVLLGVALSRRGTGVTRAWDAVRTGTQRYAELGSNVAGKTQVNARGAHTPRRCSPPVRG